MVSRKEQVKRAIRMQGPDYVPLFIFDGERDDSDIIQIDLERFYLGAERSITEWGYKWDNDNPDIPMGAPINPPIPTWETFEDYRKTKAPDPFDKSRFAETAGIMQKYGSGHYYMGSLYLTGFTIMAFLRGFCNLLEDFYLERGNLERLADLVFGIENGIVGQMKAYGFDGVSFWDDWGTQTGMIVNPKLFREVFKPRYEKQFAYAHDCGLDVFFHTCGNVPEIIPDLIEAGVDMLNLGQPDIIGIEELGRQFGGKVCFCSPVSYQTTSLSGTVEDVDGEVKRLVDSMGPYNGGLIAYIINYQKMGMPRENYEAIINAFKKYGAYR